MHELLLMQLRVLTIRRVLNYYMYKIVLSKKKKKNGKRKTETNSTVMFVANPYSTIMLGQASNLMQCFLSLLQPEKHSVDIASLDRIKS